MKPMLSLFAVMALAVSAMATGNTPADHIKDSGPNPMCFNGTVKQAKVYTVTPDGKQMPYSVIYTFKQGIDYTMDVYHGDERVRHDNYVTNTAGNRQDKVVEGEHAAEMSRVNVIENGIIVKELYPDHKTKEERPVKIFSYDEQGRLTGIDHWGDDDNGLIEKYSYKGNTIIRTIGHSIDTEDKLTRTDTYELDKHNNPVKITISGGWGASEPKVFTFKYTYDKHGNYTQVGMYRDGKLMNTQHREIAYN